MHSRHPRPAPAIYQKRRPARAIQSGARRGDTVRKNIWPLLFLSMNREYRPISVLHVIHSVLPHGCGGSIGRRSLRLMTILKGFSETDLQRRSRSGRAGNCRHQEPGNLLNSTATQQPPGSISLKTRGPRSAPFHFSPWQARQQSSRRMQEDNRLSMKPLSG